MESNSGIDVLIAQMSQKIPQESKINLKTKNKL